MKKKLCILVLSLAFLLCSCSGNFANIQNVMQPPKLTGQETAMFSALQKSSGTNVTLRYPRSGEYRSAFLVCNLDDDGNNEGIVFYKPSDSDENSNVHVKILSESNDKWNNIADIVGEGPEVDTISFGTAGGKKFVAIGYTLLNKNDKMLNLYHFNGKTLKQSFSINYSYFQICDLDSNGYDDIVSININSTSVSDNTTTFPPVSKYITWNPKTAENDEGFRVKNEVPLDITVSEYKKIQVSNLSEDKKALYLDGIKEKDVYSTEILSIENGMLKNLIYNNVQNKTKATMRKSLTCTDINYDGILEIPRNSLLPGYEAKPENERLNLTRWYSLQSGKFVEIASSYFNSEDGYLFIFPNTWGNKVSVTYDKELSETRFFAFNDSLTDTSQEILKIKTVKRSDSNSIENDSQYEKICFNGQYVYYARMSNNTDEDLHVNLNKIAANLIPLN